MLKYLKSAFWHRERLPLLGELPVNVLALCAFAALGFGHPAFWWIGGGLEAVFLFLLGTNPNYQRVIDALAAAPKQESAAHVLAALVASLSPDAATRHSRLEARLARVRSLYGDAATEFSLSSDHEHRLDHLGWLHLKLLLARDQLQRSEAENPRGTLEKQLATLEHEVAAGGSRSTQESRTATLAILRERLETAVQRTQRLEEVEADLARVEHKVELVLEKATLHANPTEMSFTLDFASSAFDASDVTETSVRPEVQQLDAYFGVAA